MRILALWSGPPKAATETPSLEVAAEPAAEVKSEECPDPPASPKPSSKAQEPSKDVPDEVPVTRGRRISLRAFSPTRKREHKPILSEAQEHEKKAGAANALAKRLAKPLSANSEKRAEESALIVRTLIVGAPSDVHPPRKATQPVAKPQMSKVKSELMKPTAANQLIAQLRVLPPSDDETTSRAPSPPIHAVCLAYPDAEEHELRFAKFKPHGAEESSKAVVSVASTPLNTLIDTFADMHIVSLIGGPDLGLGQPGNGNGILAGAVPTAETIINGIEQLTPQLMALGYATGRAVLPDHTGVHPPTDRLSVLTYWWGLELVLPPSSLVYLENAHSIQGTLLNFLTALSVLNNGVREILPFIRYMAQFIDFEFSTIKKQDRGKGVVCAATWLMPAALVPRPWDFSPAPVAPTNPESGTSPAAPPTAPDSVASTPLPVTSPVPKSLPVVSPVTPVHNVVSPGISLS
ncbi:hypothetical protein FB45DRAFT_893162 [Roridomyces roridus]|uniref:Uncharacterized protein n=1 Tax=Roridomyces roridus TaxID=1738132 RepID=A0AAD7CF99_9AGAR|nr:hypothetical protein FB45DRAFT_893162 [Roridomyces roridus]